MQSPFAPFLPDAATNPRGAAHARAWLLSGVAALALGGVFSILLVLARSAHVQAHIPFKQFFHTALVVHVDLSVLLWFLMAASLLWFLGTGARVTMLTKAALGCFWAGMLIMALTPFTGDAHPILNNYVPVLQHPLFFMALGFVLCGTLFQAAHALWFITPLPPSWRSHASHGRGERRGEGSFLPLPRAGEGRGEGCHALHPHRALAFGLWSSALMAVLAAAALVASHLLLPPDLTGEAYYESLFWGGGHLLQFVHTQLLILMWLWLAFYLRERNSVPLPPGEAARLRRDSALAAAQRVRAIPIFPATCFEKILYALFTFGLLAVMAGFFPYLRGDVDGVDFHRFFTLHMAFLNGTYTIPAALIALRLSTSHPPCSFFRSPVMAKPCSAWTRGEPKPEASASGFGGGEATQKPPATPIRHALLASLALFATGGVFSLFIEGSNVIIPAHYHGSIVGVSLAYMGIFYLLMPRLGMQAPQGRMASLQPLFYGGGQLLHIAGLFISGGYDVARKTTQSYEGVTGAQIGMGLMGLGGLIAIIGGLMFVLVVWRCRKK